MNAEQLVSNIASIIMVLSAMIIMAVWVGYELGDRNGYRRGYLHGKTWRERLEAREARMLQYRRLN